MTKKAPPQVVYMPQPAPTQAPAQSAEQLKFTQSLQEQLKQMQDQYGKQTGNLQTQYEQTQKNSAGLLAEMQQQLAAQKAASATTADELLKAREASQAQSALLQAQSLASQQQYADQRQGGIDMASSLFGRFQRRQKQRNTVYSA